MDYLKWVFSRIPLLPAIYADQQIEEILQLLGIPEVNVKYVKIKKREKKREGEKGFENEKYLFILFVC